MTLRPIRYVRPRGPLWTFLLLGLAGLAAISIQWSCNDQAGPESAGPPKAREGVPLVRVLITPQPLGQLTLASSGACWLEVDGASIARSKGPMQQMTVSRKGGKWQLGPIAAGGRLPRFIPGPATHFTVGEITYRGEIILLPTGPNNFQVINRLDMESYLAGVLPRELFPSWPLETHRALAVAARTFAMYHCLTFGRSNEYDLGSNQSAQVYGGLAAETPTGWQALHSTRGRILTWGPAGDERIFMAQYSSCCGGHVNGAGVIRNAQDIQPLRGGQACNYCSSASRYRWPAVRFAKDDIYDAIAARYPAAAKLSGVAEIRVVEKTDYGRVVWVDVIDAQGESIRLRAEDIRLSMLRSGLPNARSLYSMNCRWRNAGDSIEFYDGRGYGHGVGLCQWGAFGMAGAGFSGEQILQFYYPGAKLHKAY